MQDKVAVITGGGSGIGLAIAQSMVSAGVKVTICGRNADRLKAAAGDTMDWVVMDVANEVSVVAGMDQIAKKHGQIDICIANAGIAEGQNIKGSTFVFWRNIMAINLDGTYLTVREAMRHMPVKNWGRVIAISSVAGIRALKGAHAYAASKHGVVGMIKSLAADHATKPVTFNAVCPGYVDTDIITRNTDSISERAGISAEAARALMVELNPHQRLITPDEVAQSVMWLCGPGSGSVDGQTITISGGPI